MEISNLLFFYLYKVFAIGLWSLDMKTLKMLSLTKEVKLDKIFPDLSGEGC